MKQEDDQVTRKHLRDVERNNKDTFKPVAKYYSLHRHFKKHMVVFGLSPQLGSQESRKTLEQKFSAFQSTNIFLFFLVTMFPPIT